MSPRTVNKRFSQAGLTYLPGDTYMAGMSLEDRWLEVTLCIPQHDGGLDRTHERCLADPEGYLRLLHSRSCERPEEFSRDLA